MYRPLLCTLVLLLTGCADGFRAHPRVVARVGDDVLTVSDLAALLGDTAAPAPTLDAVEGLARHWVEVTALLRATHDRPLGFDSAALAGGGWLQRRRERIEAYRQHRDPDRRSAGADEIDSVFAAGRLRLVAHVFRRAGPETAAAARARQQEIATQLRAGLVAGGSWEEANRLNQDDAARARNGSLGLIQPGQTTPAFDRAAFGLGPGELSTVVQTERGFHVIYRPRLEEVRTGYAQAVTPHLIARRDSLFDRRLAVEANLAVHPGAAREVRRAASDPHAHLGRATVLGTATDVEVTTGTLARHLLHATAGARAAMAEGLTPELDGMVRRLVLDTLLLARAHRDGVDLDSSRAAEIDAAVLRRVARVLAILDPDSLSAATGDSAARGPTDPVRRYLAAAARGQTPVRTLPPFLAQHLLDRVDSRVYPAGLLHAVREATLARRPAPGDAGG